MRRVAVGLGRLLLKLERTNGSAEAEAEAAEAEDDKRCRYPGGLTISKLRILNLQEVHSRRNITRGFAALEDDPRARAIAERRE